MIDMNTIAVNVKGAGYAVDEFTCRHKELEHVTNCNQGVFLKALGKHDICRRKDAKMTIIQPCSATQVKHWC